MAGRTLNIPAIALGKFDAMHLGHRALAQRAVEVAGSACLLSFTGMAEILAWPPRLPLVAPSDRTRVISIWSQGWARAVTEATMPFAEIREPQRPVTFCSCCVSASCYPVRGGRGGFSRWA